MMSNVGAVLVFAQQLVDFCLEFGDSSLQACLYCATRNGQDGTDAENGRRERARRRITFFGRAKERWANAKYGVPLRIRTRIDATSSVLEVGHLIFGGPYSGGSFDDGARNGWRQASIGT